MGKQYLSELIKGERISLKKHEIELADKMYQYVVEDRERLSVFLPWPNLIKSVDDEINFINRCNKSWDEQVSSHYGIYRNSDDEYMGNISSFSFNWTSGSCEIGYWILGKFEGKGYMSDAVKLIEKTLYGMGFNRVVIRFDPNNKRLGSIPKRLGYKLEGTLRDAIYVDGQHQNLKVYSKLKREYESNLQDSEILKQFVISEQITDKGVICNQILRSLPEWFGIESAIQNYTNEVEEMVVFVAKQNNQALGFISLNQHNPFTAEIHVMGVSPNYHGKGIGTALVRKVEKYLEDNNSKFLQVKTLGESRNCKEYGLTRKFYDSVGFYPVEEFKELWDEDNPCLLMIKTIREE